MILFHLTTRREWAAAQAAGSYQPPSLASEGFIHLSTEAQWPATRARFYAGVPDMVLLVIDSARVPAEIRFERADGDDFPHAYGELPVEAVVEIRELT